MRFSKQIAALTEEAKGVEFPIVKWTEADNLKARFAEKLRTLINHNFKISTRDVEYNEEHAVYQWRVSQTITFHFDNAVMLTTEARYFIDPRKDLAAEFARIADEIERNRKLNLQFGKFATSIGGDWR